jgi:integrase
MAVFSKNGTWWIDYYYQDKRYRQKIGTRKRDAEEALSRVRVKIASGEFIPPKERERLSAAKPQDISFKSFAIEEFLPWSQSQHSAKHYIRLESAIRVHLLPYFGHRVLSDITTRMIEEYKISRSRDHFKRGKKSRKVNPATINREVCCLKVMLRKATEWGRIEDSPARGIRAFRETSKKPKLIEQDEVARLLEQLPDHFRALIATAVYSGLRRSELFHLRWEDINWKTNELTVVSRAEHHTKNYESRRIPMNNALVEILQYHKRNHIIIGSPYAFSNREGKTYTDIREPICAAAERAGIEGAITMHQLRHAFCSHALMQGIDPRTVQKWMGHKDLKTTLRYAHVSPAHEKAAIQLLKYVQNDTINQVTNSISHIYTQPVSDRD